MRKVMTRSEVREYVRRAIEELGVPGVVSMKTDERWLIAKSMRVG